MLWQVKLHEQAKTKTCGCYDGIGWNWKIHVVAQHDYGDADNTVILPFPNLNQALLAGFFSNVMIVVKIMVKNIKDVSKNVFLGMTESV